MVKGDIAARLRGLRNAPPNEAAQDEFYNGLGAIAQGAVLQLHRGSGPPDNAAGQGGHCNTQQDQMAAPGTALAVEKRPKAGWDKRVAVRVSIVVSSSYAARITEFSAKAKSTPDDVVRRIWNAHKSALLAALPEASRAMEIRPNRRAPERGLYLGTTITLEAGVMEAIAAQHDPMGVHGRAKLVKCAITPAFERVIDAELKKAGF